MKAFVSSSSFITLNKKRKNDENKNTTSKKSKPITSTLSSSSSSSSIPTSMKVLTTSNKSNLKQMFLDLGQRSFGRNTLCQKCGDLDDEKSHSSYCNKYLEGPLIATIKGHKVLETFNEGTDNESYIIEVKYDQKLNQDTISRVLNTVKEELGSTTDYIKGTETIYFYIHRQLVIGCLIIEKLDTSTKLVLLSSEQSASDLMVSNDKTINNNEKPIENTKSDGSPTNHPLVGIRQIWVDRKFRKQKVANKLVDAARKNFLYGVIIPRNGIAFSQPTSDGQAFGFAYTNNSHNIWAYA